MSYGIANKIGKFDSEKLLYMINSARASGIDTIDTAMTYGDSESRLGGCLLNDWRIVTKLPSIPPNVDEVKDWVPKMVEGALNRLQQKKIHGLLLHNPNDLLSNHGEELYKALSQLKTEGMVCKIGISIYSDDELSKINSRYPLDLIQAPFNIFDRRLASSGWLERLSRQGVEIHTRSTFLQGLLLMPSNLRPTKFRKWESLWLCWDEWLLDNNISPLAACVRFSLNQPEIDRVVIGVDSPEQLQEILDASEGQMPEIPTNLFSADVSLINPARWADL